MLPYYYGKHLRQRPYSIRTRIKTSSRVPCSAVSTVRDHIPLEQGLRQRVAAVVVARG